MFANSTQLRRRRHARVAAQKDKPPASSNHFLDVQQVCFEKSLLAIGVAGGAQLEYRCGSRSLRIPAGRLAYSENTYRSHEEQVRKLTRKERCPHDSPELVVFIAPALSRWAAGRTKLDVLELGPAHTTDVPDVLESSLASYTAVDFSPPFLRKQRELLAHNPSLLARSRQVIADTYDLSLPDASCDLVVVSCHPPLVSAPVEDKFLVIDKIHAFLRPKGVLALFPWFFEEQQEEVTRHLLKRFAMRHVAMRGVDTNRLFLFLEKA